MHFAKLSLLALVFFVSFTGVAQTPQPSSPQAANSSQHSESKVRERLNQIFYWQISDELKLSTKQEKELIAIVEDIQNQRAQFMATRDQTIESLRKLGRAPSNKEAEKALKAYNKAVESLAGLDAQESKRLSKVLNTELLVRFYVIREDVIAKVKEALEKRASKN